MFFLIKNIQDILNNPLSSIIILGNIILMESILSIDNAAVLATIVVNMKKENRIKALKYGIIGAYIFRSICLLSAAFIVKIWWLKPLGGLYLFIISIKYFIKKSKINFSPKNSSIYNKNLFSSFWISVVYIEIVDLAFSIDNIFAAVAFSKNILLIFIGVFIGILTMRFIAQYFMHFMHKYIFLHKSAFLIMLLLSLRLLFSVYEKLFPTSKITLLLNSFIYEFLFSTITILIFFVPIIFHKILNKK